MVCGPTSAENSLLHQSLALFAGINWTTLSHPLNFMSYCIPLIHHQHNDILAACLRHSPATPCPSSLEQQPNQLDSQSHHWIGDIVQKQNNTLPQKQANSGRLAFNAITHFRPFCSL
jgi:hypothetical protein